ncbi:hypothetical protein CRG98_032098 [Punica granatum]|uniref:Uncharacterized protein n=1 Tax=Punica granatum TaxID=22663 RepID=A0A2I0IU19_PUNGR|nr:hypothetical protein CRG98_032098 [Punica granatum]
MYRLRGQGTFSHCSFVATTTAPLESNLIFQSRNGGSKSSETSTWTGDVVFVLAFFLFCPAAKDSRSLRWRKGLETRARGLAGRATTGTLDGTKVLAPVEAPRALLLKFCLMEMGLMGPPSLGWTISFQVSRADYYFGKSFGSTSRTASRYTHYCRVLQGFA